MKILIIRFSSIGDIVLTTPVVRCLKKQLPKVEIHFLTKQGFFPILEANPYISKTYLVQKELEEVLPQLRAEKYDLIIDLHHNLRSWKIKRKLGVPSHSFSKLNIQKWMKVNWGIDRLPALHIVDRYLKTVERLGVKNDRAGLDYFFPANKKVTKSDIPVSHQEGFIAIAIGAQHATKRMPTEKIRSLILNMDRQVVLIGGKEDLQAGEAITMGLEGNVWNTCGKFDLHGSASLVEMADLVITHDTGMMHIAAAFRKKIVSVWGNTIPEFGMYPYLPEHPERSVIIENKNLKCRPCSKIGYAKCPKGHFNCMQQIKDEEILTAVERLG